MVGEAGTALSRGEQSPMHTGTSNPNPSRVRREDIPGSFRIHGRRTCGIHNVAACITSVPVADTQCLPLLLDIVDIDDDIPG